MRANKSGWIDVNVVHVPKGGAVDDREVPVTRTQAEAHEVEVAKLRTEIDRLTEERDAKADVAMLRWDELEKLKKDLKYAREHVLDLFQQGCRIVSKNTNNHGKYDHMCISTYEAAQEYLIDLKLIERQDCVRG